MKLIVLLFVIAATACQAQVEINNIADHPVITDSDKKLFNVYELLDGTWKGVFLVKQDESPKKRPENLQDPEVMLEFIETAKTINTIHVTQVYASESPYFQKVSITDFYPDSGKTVESNGVNKVQAGKMWCVVHKPDETVIHAGSAPNKETIIWQSNLPKRIEYFHETVSKDFYEIIGYGYYNDDDTSKSPLLWFYGKYERQ